MRIISTVIFILCVLAFASEIQKKNIGCYLIIKRTWVKQFLKFDGKSTPLFINNKNIKDPLIPSQSFIIFFFSSLTEHHIQYLLHTQLDLAQSVTKDQCTASQQQA